VGTLDTSTWEVQTGSQLELQKSTARARGRAGGALKQAVEAKPSSRGDARAAGRVAGRTGGTPKAGPDKKVAPVRCLTANAQRLRLR
jgi:hypothetical protein